MSKQYDPQMHSAEHLLNQAMVRLYGSDRCFSAHINKKKSKCDYRFDRNLSDSEIQTLQDEVNHQIEKDFPIKIEMLQTQIAQEKYNIDRVPDKEGLDELRIVSMGDYDACPCIGPHVEKTSQIGRFKITTTGFEDGVLRIRFKLT
jgi:misacylated tRNA(Ala) deacylase